jgi:hypothetical protein
MAHFGPLRVAVVVADVVVDGQRQQRLGEIDDLFESV